MLLTISTTHQPATDLGYLLHKHPDRAQTFPLTFGTARVFYPDAAPELCTAALLVDVDPIGIVRGRATSIDQYVNDRPYVASSFTSVALSRVFGTAMAGRCEQRPELAQTAIPLVVRVSVVRSKGGAGLVRRLFEPLGYQVLATVLPTDPRLAEWTDSDELGTPHVEVELRGTVRLSELLRHLYVLLPVLDDAKHHWVDEAEIDKLVAKGDGWLGSHPERELVSLRFLRRQRAMARRALRAIEGPSDDESVDRLADRDVRQRRGEAAHEKPLRLNEKRMEAVTAALTSRGARTVIDLGCGEGRLLRRLLRERTIERVVGLDVSVRSLGIAGERLGLERMGERERARVELLHGALTYRDRRIEGFDAATLVEVIEHVDRSRHEALERVVFGCAAPRLVVVTTPNVEFNVRFENVAAGRLRHGDHRFEWTRDEFRAWAARVAERWGYACAHDGIGDVDENLGAPTQMAVFTRSGGVRE